MIPISDLSSSYTYYLKPQISNLNALAMDPTVTIMQYRARVLEIIIPAKDTPKKRLFTERVRTMVNKRDIQRYIENSCNKADRMSASFKRK